MIRALLVPALLLILAIPVEAMADGTESAQSFTPAQMAGIEAFWRDCLHEAAVGSVQVMGVPQKDRNIPSACLHARVTNDSIPEEADIDFSADNGLIFSYVNLRWPDEPGVEGHTLKDAIPEDLAWERASSVFKHYGLSPSRKDCEIALEDNGNLKEDDLYGARWIINHKLSRDGTPCAGSYLLVSVSAYSGRIFHVKFSPVYVPRIKREPLVSREEAFEKAEAWLKSRERLKSVPLEVGNALGEEATEVIARPHTPFWDENTSKPDEGAPDAVASYYCWQVPYRLGEGEHQLTLHLWVRIDDGEVIGGN